MNSNDEYISTPPELGEIAQETTHNLLPKESKELYDKQYKHFQDWKKLKKAGTNSENVMLAYFSELSKSYAPSSLYSKFSFLKSTFKLYDNLDLNQYSKVLAFLKRTAEGYKPRKAKVLTEENVREFINTAPDIVYLATKAAMIFGIMGGLRSIELKSVEMSHLEYHGDNLILVKIPITKNKMEKSFTIHGDFYKIVKQYLNLRPANVQHNRVFVNFQRGKCTMQPIGKNKLAAMPKEIAKFLKLKDAELYTGHSFRRTSTTMLANAGANITTIKRHGGWKSAKVAESYIEDSLSHKKKIGNLIGNSIQTILPPPSNPSSSNSNFSRPDLSLRKFTYKTPILCKLSTQEIESNCTEPEASLENFVVEDVDTNYSTEPEASLENVGTNSIEPEASENIVGVNNETISPSKYIIEDYEYHYVDTESDIKVQESTIPQMEYLPNNFNFSFTNCTVNVNVNK